jgi:hypothetical protein
MSAPKVELTSEGVKHSLTINGVVMNKMIRKAVITIEANQIVSYELTYGGTEPSRSPELDSTSVGSNSKEFLTRQELRQRGII